MRLSLEKICRAMKVDLDRRFRDVVVTSVTTDSREVVPGALFVCVPGERVDGHDFVRTAAERGACAVLAQRPVEALPGVAVLEVKDTIKAMGIVARTWRNTYKGTVVSLTGTAGKTTVKELLASVLSQSGSVARTERNHNNQVGMPLAMLAAHGDEAFWVMEAGISHEKDMDELGVIMHPDAALVLNAGSGHTEGLGKKGVAWHKARLLKYRKKGGVGIVSADYPALAAEAAKFSDVHWFSAKPADEAAADAPVPEVRVTEQSVDASGTLYKASFADGTGFSVHTPLRGDSGAEDCAAVALMGRLLGLSDTAIARGIASTVLPEQRFRHLRRGKSVVIDDTYNANPLSMGRMVDASASEAKALGKPLVCVLGEMRELGSVAAQSHEELGRHLAALKPVRVFWKGGEADAVLRGLTEGGSAVPFIRLDQTPFEQALEDGSAMAGLEDTGAVVLFKGSRSNRLEKEVEAFMQAPVTAGGKND